MKFKKEEEWENGFPWVGEPEWLTWLSGLFIGSLLVFLFSIPVIFGD